MKKYTLQLLVLLGVVLQVHGQSLKKALRLANTAYAQKNYDAAYLNYQKAFLKDTTSTNVCFKLAESARQINSHAIAARYYIRVLGSADKGKYLEARLRLGQSLQNLADYRNAQVAYLQFLQEAPTASAELLMEVKKGVEDCDFALKSIQNVANVQRNPYYYPQPVNMGPEINSPYNDYGASFHGDTLYHTSHEFPDPNKKASRLNKVVRTYPGKAKELPPSFNAPDQHTAYSVFTPDNKGVYYCNCVAKNAKDLHCDIFYRPLNIPGAVPLKLGINLPNYTSTSPAIGKSSKGETVLYFVSDRPGGKGKLDIWMGAIQSDGNVTTATPVAELNSIQNDISPFYQEIQGKAQLLFFATDGRKTFGGIDIYGTRLNQTKRWIEPYNLGSNINSSYDDFGYIRDRKGETVVFASNRVDSIQLNRNYKTPSLDLYKAIYNKLYYMEINTFKWRDSLALNGATVSVFEEMKDGTRKELLSKTEADANNYSTLIEPFKKYYVQVQKQGFIAVDSLIIANLAEEQTSIVVDLYLPNLRLDVFTLYGPDPKDPAVNGCEVTISEILPNSTRPKILKRISHPNTNEYNFGVELGKKYRIHAAKPGYPGDWIDLHFNEEVVKEFGYDISVDLYLSSGNYGSGNPKIQLRRKNVVKD